MARTLVLAAVLGVFGLQCSVSKAPAGPRNRFRVTITSKDCPGDRIETIAATPGALAPGERAFVEVWTSSTVPREKTQVSIATRWLGARDAGAGSGLPFPQDAGVGQDLWTPSTDCSEQAILCGWFACPSVSPTPASEMRGSEDACQSYEIGVRVEDPDCVDEESLVVRCDQE